MKKVIITLLTSIVSITLLCYLILRLMLYAPHNFHKDSWSYWLIPSLYVLETTPAYHAITEPVYSYDPRDGERSEYVTMQYDSRASKTQLVILYRRYFISINCMVKLIHDRFDLDRVLAGKCTGDNEGFIRLSIDNSDDTTTKVLIVFTNYRS